MTGDVTDPESLTTLYRPVGRAELALIEALQFRAFPPRLPEQPIFYAVIQEAYATQIARDWNPKDEASGYAGLVTRFQVRSAFLRDYEVRTVGSAQHQEYWIPAEHLPAFNAAIIGRIEVVAEYIAEPPRWDWPALNRAVERVLWEVWDPIGVRSHAPSDEYDGYAPAITRLLFQQASDAELMAALAAVETGSLGLAPRVTESLAPVVEALRAAADRVARRAP